MHPIELANHGGAEEQMFLCSFSCTWLEYFDRWRHCHLGRVGSPSLARGKPGFQAGLAGRACAVSAVFYSVAQLPLLRFVQECFTRRM